MRAHREEHLELTAALVLGCIDEADRLELEAHLAAGCSECDRELARLSAGVRALAASVPQMAPPPALRGRVLDAVRAETAAPPKGSATRLERRRRVSYVTWAWAAAAVLAASTLVVWREGYQLRDRLTSTERQIAQLRKSLEDQRKWAALLDSPSARVVNLAPTPDGAPTLHARAVYDSASGRALLVFENFAPPAGSDYELWAIRGAGPSSLGLIRADASGRAVLRFENLGDPASLQGFAISLEDKGGSPNSRQPLGPVVMAGKLGA